MAPGRTAPAKTGQVTLLRRDEVWAGCFSAMASPCEVLVDTRPRRVAIRLVEAAAAEAFRIERKFSRYRDDNIVHEIQHALGRPIAVDDETAALLDFADRCYRLSDGRFDITAGVLRRVWRFDGSDRLPAPEAVAAIRPFIGWEKVCWTPPTLTVPEGMEIDFGGIGKEYAVDRVHALLAAATDAAFLVNFGGDLRASGPRSGGQPWRVGVDDPAAAGVPVRIVELLRGALATSGDTRRFLERDGVRYSHILDPRTGWPVVGAPRSITVAAPTCTEAGMLATFAMLRGSEAEVFLDAERVRHWCIR
ncbi:MAG TPA: FAD:protein FMN transferase [Candidatus Udaeobacter sp.]|nr:FAD:protein FMN transferase [Candidatus Udaeobacter sp.]